MELKAYYRLISSEGRAPKIVTAFPLAAAAEDFTNYRNDAIAAPVASMPSGGSPEGGSTRGD